MQCKYHVGCGLFGIYAGILKSDSEWKDKTEVTEEALEAVAQYLIVNHEARAYTTKNGKSYALKVEELPRGEIAE